MINTPRGRFSKHDDSYIRMLAIQRKIPYVTSLAAAAASIEGIEETRKTKAAPKSLQDYHKGLEK